MTSSPSQWPGRHTKWIWKSTVDGQYECALCSNMAELCIGFHCCLCDKPLSVLWCLWLAALDQHCIAPFYSWRGSSHTAPHCHAQSANTQARFLAQGLWLPNRNNEKPMCMHLSVTVTCMKDNCKIKQYFVHPPLCICLLLLRFSSSLYRFSVIRLYFNWHVKTHLLAYVFPVNTCLTTSEIAVNF